jgi:hypothetical protein
LPFVEPFFEVHGDHAHAVTGELFPLLTSRLIRWFGIRGAYALPAAGFLGILIGTAWLAVALDRRRNTALVVLMAAVAAPFLFYGLEFWEHAPAVALATLATALWVTSFSRLLAGGAVSAAASGLMFGLAFLLRPETAWAALAVVVSWLALGEHRQIPENAPRRPHTALLIGLVVAGAAVVLAPFEIYTLRHFGRVMPAHLGANAGLLQTSWLAERAHLVADWFLPSGWGRSGPRRPESIWAAAPVILLAAVPIRTDSPRGRTFLALTATLTAALVLLTAPNDGGGQWTPRYLLFAFVPLTILGADVVQALPRRNVTTGILIVLLLACVWIQRSSYRNLRGTKNLYGRVVDFVGREVAPGGMIVTDLWWFDQIAAAATTGRRLVYVPDAAGGHSVMQRLSRAVVPIVTVIRSSSESPDLSAWREETCYVEIKRDTVDVRGLVAITLHHRCPG